MGYTPCEGTGRIAPRGSKTFAKVGNIIVATHGICPRCGKKVALTSYDYIRSHKAKPGMIDDRKVL